MGKSSINIQGASANSETHNLREKKYKHVREDLTSKNFNWGFETKLSELRQEQEKLYLEKIGQKMQKKATPIREGVFLFEEHHTNEQLLKVVQGVQAKFGIKAVQLSVHRDEGHFEKHTKIWKPNLHAHVLFDWQDKNTGKSFKLGRKEMSELQTYFAEALGMERGKKSLKSHKNALEYKIEALEKELDFLKEDKGLAKIDVQHLQVKLGTFKNALEEEKEKWRKTQQGRAMLEAYLKLKKEFPKIKELGEKKEREIQGISGRKKARKCRLFFP